MKTNRGKYDHGHDPSSTTGNNFIQEPTDNDILCGKSRDCLSHIGSRRYRAYISRYIDSYSEAQTKYEKMTITKEIYANLSPTCRFLRYNKNRRMWEEVSFFFRSAFSLHKFVPNWDTRILTCPLCCCFFVIFPDRSAKLMLVIR